MLIAMIGRLLLEPEPATAKQLKWTARPRALGSARRAHWSIPMTKLIQWWDERTAGEKAALAVVGGIVTIATGGALAYAIATGGVVVVTGETVVLFGAATSLYRAGK